MNIETRGLRQASPLLTARSGAPRPRGEDAFVPCERPDLGLIPPPNRLYRTALAVGMLVGSAGVGQAAEQAVVQRAQDGSSKGMALMASQTEGAVQEVLKDAAQGPGPSCATRDSSCESKLRDFPWRPNESTWPCLRR